MTEPIQDTEPQDGTAEITPAAVVEFVWAFVTELHPHLSRRSRPGLDSSLESDLSLDSLSRMELLVRLERQFHVRLSEQLMTQAESPRDLLRGMLAASTHSTMPRSLEIQHHGGLDTDEVPDSARTLVDVLNWHVQRHPERVHLYFYDEQENATALTYGELRTGAEHVATGLRAGGFEPGQTAAVMLPSCVEYFFCFLGILLAGGIPVPIYPPMRMSQMEDHVRRHTDILDNASVTTLITFDEAKPVALLLMVQVESLRQVATVAELGQSVDSQPDAVLGEDNIAFIQYTSGSTGNPKGVVLTHQNILANIDAMGGALEVTPKDVFVSWLPLYHDMGLIGAWMGSLRIGFTLVLMSPLTFLSRPSVWLRIIHAHRATVSGGPNFSFELCLQRVDDEDIEALDLSCWRIAFNGAEPVSADTMRRFQDRFSRYGLSKTAISPVYGLAEATLGLGFPPIGRGLHTDRVERDSLALEAKATPAPDNDESALEVVACGRPMPGYQARVVDTAGRELPERHQGRLEFKGPSTTSGYYRNPEATDKLFNGEWLDSGDLAYIAAGDIYITSREKDMIIRGGRNIYPYELEEAAGNLEGIRKGCVAVFASTDSRTRTERLIVVAETRETNTERRTALESRINELAVTVIGMPADEVVLARPRTVLKTSSGKIRRSATAERYDNKELDTRGKSVALQIVRLAGASIRPGLRRLRRRMGEYASATWTWLIVAVTGILCWLSVWLAPNLNTRWYFLRRLGRSAVWLTGTKLIVEGSGNLPRAGGFVLVANHQSYLDGPLLALSLPVTVSYVVKGELSTQPLLGPFLRRIGLSFVERFDRQRSLQDARKVRATLESNRPIGYFPEGTLRRMPGLLPFHMGAFVAAAETGVPVIPVTLRGTRSILRDESWFPRLGAVRIVISEPLLTTPGLSDESQRFHEAVRLRDAARGIMLQNCGEPDLVEHQVTLPTAAGRKSQNA